VRALRFRQLLILDRRGKRCIASLRACQSDCNDSRAGKPGLSFRAKSRLQRSRHSWRGQAFHLSFSELLVVRDVSAALDTT
jgi:hypothetical protein